MVENFTINEIMATRQWYRDLFNMQRMKIFCCWKIYQNFEE